MELFDAILTRRSIRKYKPVVISDKLIHKILEAATWAPSAHNAQPWRFLVLRDAEAKCGLAEAMAEKYRIDLTGDGMPLEKCEEMINLSLERFTSAPILVIACLTMTNMNRYPDDKRQEAERTMAVQSVAAAIQNMLLVAHAVGLGACWFCAPLFCPETVKGVLRLPENVEPQALIALGYPDERPNPPPRFPVEEVVHQGYWRSRR